MPRPTRLNIPGVPQHITQRGNNRQACFYTDKDCRLYLNLLDSACRVHDCWLLLGEDDTVRRATYSGLFRETLDQLDVEHIRHSINTGLPTGNDSFKREIEKALSIRLGQGKRGRPKKAQT